MKFYLLTLQIALILSALAARGQGTMIYDQQSATNRSVSGSAPIQAEQPMGQSFTPTLSSVGFVQLEFIDAHAGNGVGATVYVNLRADSLTGTILDSTAPVFMPDGFNDGITNFFFATPVAVTLGTTYYLQPVVQSGEDWGIVAGPYNYPGGTFFLNGAPDPNGFDAWFREGALVPEPSSGLLVLLGVGVIGAAKRLRRFRAGILGVIVLGTAASGGTLDTQAQTLQRIWSPPLTGSFYSMQSGTNVPPLPFLPFDVPVYQLDRSSSRYVYDDTTIDYS